MANGLFNVHMQVMWNRLIAVVEEQALTLVRTAFSTSVVNTFSPPVTTMSFTRSTMKR